MVLCHELCHIKRHDVAYKALFLWASCVHWFNPLVWWLGRAAGRNVELCCDDDVLRGKDKSFRRQYGEVLLTMAAGGNGPALSTQFGGSVAEMKKRLSNLFVHKKSSRILVISVLLCTLLAGMLVACQPQQEKGTGGKPIEALQETITYDGRTLSFTLPEDDVAWNILISGRMEAEGMGGMSIHYLEGTEWNPGEAYSFEMSQETAAALTELTMDVWAGEEEGSIDLLPYLDAASEKLYFSVSLTEVQRYTPPEGQLLSNPDVVPADTMGEVLVETTLSDGTDVLCYWEPDSECTKYWAIRKGDALLRFCMEDSGYDGGYGIREYEDVLGQDGFCISGPRGAAYSFIDYYYLDKDGIPRLLVDCATQVVEQDWTGDGERELLWTYHQYEGYYYFRRDGDIYLCSLNALLQTARPDWEKIAIHLGETDDPLYVTYEKDGTACRASLSFTQTDLLVEMEI